MSERETIERDGRRLVLVPEETLNRLEEAAEDLDDIRAYDRAKAKPQEFVPAAIADRLIAGERPVKVWREYRGMTQKRLADAADISKPYLSQIENGLRDASIGVLRELAAALKVDLDDLSPPPAESAAKVPKGSARARVRARNPDDAGRVKRRRAAAAKRRKAKAARG